MYRYNTTGNKVVGFSDIPKPGGQTTTYYSTSDQYHCPYDRDSYSVKWSRGNPYKTFYNNYTTTTGEAFGKKKSLMPVINSSSMITRPNTSLGTTTSTSYDVNVGSGGGGGGFGGGTAKFGGGTTNTYSYTTRESYSPAIGSVSRSMEKEELQRLNERFSQYVMKVRQLGQQSSSMDSAAFLQSIRILEDEVVNLKSLYEKELDNLRRQLDAAVQDRNNLQIHCSKYQVGYKEMEDKLLSEADKNRKMIDQMNGMQQRITSLEQELVQARAAAVPRDDIPRLQREIDNLNRENEGLKQRLASEQSARQAAEEKSLASNKKADFDLRVQNEQQADLRQRLDTSSATIIALENKIKELSKTDTNVPALLRQVREAAEEELRKYQREAEEQNNKNMYALKIQMESDSKTIDRLEKEKAQAMNGVGDFKTALADLEARLKAAEGQRLSLEQLLQQERARFAAQLQGMEKRFSDFQNNLFIKLKEANMSREGYIPLKAEIEAMKVLLSEEEKRVNAAMSASKVQTSYISGSSPQPFSTSYSYQTTSPMVTSYKTQTISPNVTSYKTTTSVNQCNYSPCVRMRTNQRRY